MSRQDGGNARRRLAESIRDLRENRGLSQLEAATRAGIPLRNWSRYESPKGSEPGFNALARIARALDVPAGVLFDGLTPEELGQLPSWNDRVDDRLDEILELVQAADARRQMEEGVADALQQDRSPPESSAPAKRGRKKIDPAA